MFKGTTTVTPVYPVPDPPSEPTKRAQDDGAAISVRTFTETTTMHGCHSTMQADYHVIRRSIWVILMLVSTAFFLNAFIRGVMKYRTSPSSISVDIEPHKELALPDVTVCNNNIVRKSFLESQSSSIQKMLINPMDPTLDSSVNTTSYFQFYVDAMDPLDEFISWCLVNSTPLDCGQHIQPTMTFGGACYTLSVAQYPLVLTTPYAGLMFEISVDESEYTPTKYGGVGVKLMFHQHGEMPDEGLAVNIHPQTDVHVAIKQTQNNRLGTPYSTDDCHDDQFADYKLSSRYTKFGCEVECYVRYFEEFLGCDYAHKLDDVRDCSLLETTLNAVDAYSYMLSDKCVCLRPCNETVYSTDISAMAHRNTLSSADQSVKKITVTVYYPTFDVTVVSQKPSYDLNSFVADVGGQMGFFLGASILTLSEFLEFFIVFIIKKLK